MVFCSSVWFICIVGFIELYTEYTFESMHVKLKELAYKN